MSETRVTDPTLSGFRVCWTCGAYLPAGVEAFCGDDCAEDFGPDDDDE